MEMSEIWPVNDADAVEEHKGERHEFVEFELIFVSLMIRTAE